VCFFLFNTFNTVFSGFLLNLFTRVREPSPFFSLLRVTVVYPVYPFRPSEVTSMYLVGPPPFYDSLRLVQLSFSLPPFLVWAGSEQGGMRVWTPGERVHEVQVS